MNSADKLMFQGEMRSPKPLNKTSSSKIQIILTPCSRHPEEILKFIDVSTTLLETHCEVCIVKSENDFKQMKLERIVDLQTNFKKFIKTHMEQLKVLEQKVESMKKETIDSEKNV